MRNFYTDAFKPTSTDPVQRAAEERNYAQQKAAHDWAWAQPERKATYNAYHALVDEESARIRSTPPIDSQSSTAHLNEVLAHYVRMLQADVRGQCVYEALTMCYDCALHAAVVRAVQAGAEPISNAVRGVDSEQVACEARRYFDEFIKPQVLP